MLCELQVYSKVIHLYKYAHLFFSKFFSHLGYFRILSGVPYAKDSIFLSTTFMNLLNPQDSLIRSVLLILFTSKFSFYQ